MATFADRIGAAIKAAQNPQSSTSDSPHKYQGFKENGAVVMRDSRGTAKQELPDLDEKSMSGGDDPMAIYKPSGAKHVDAAKAMGAFTNWVYAAVNAIAMEVANIEWRLFQIKDDGDHEEQDDHELLTLLDGVNETMTGIELKYVTIAHLELTGNAFWFMEGVMNDTDRPTALYPLDPGRMKITLNKESFPYKVNGYEMTLDGKVYKFMREQILHIKYPDPSDPFVGIGVPQAVPNWIDSDNYAMEYNRKYFLNGAQVGLYIKTDTNVEGNIDRIRKGWANRHEGTANAHKTPVLPKGTELKHTGVTHRDMDFGNLTDKTRDRVLAAFRVSKTILGTAESDTNRATAETADYVFSKRTIKPKMLLVVSYINEFLVPRYGDDLYLTFLDPVPEDKAARTTEMQAAAGNGVPIMTQNEVRKNYLGIGPIDGGDKLMRPSTMVDAGTSESVEGEDPTPQLARAQEKTKVKAQTMKTARTAEGWETKAVRTRKGVKSRFSATKTMRDNLSKAFEEALGKKLELTYTVKSVKDLTKHEYMEHWKRFADRSERAEAELKDIFLGVNAKQKKQVISNLPDVTGQKALSDLFDLKEWISIVVDLATPILENLAKDESAAAFQMIGVAQQDILSNPKIREALDRGISKMARSYNETTLAQLKQVIGEKMTQAGGTNLKELTDAVNGVYDFADGRRAGLIAKTESYRAGNWANKEAWKESGVVHTVQWYTAEDAQVCVFCADMEAQGPIDIGSNFLDDGDTFEADGKTFTASYGDVEAPPLHPDCRCYLRPEDISI